MKSLTTEARVVCNQENIQFTNNFIEMFLIQQGNDSHFTLKITGILLKSSNHYTFFEKRQDITDILHKRGVSSMNVQVKANETNNLCKNSFELTFNIHNQDRKSKK